MSETKTGTKVTIVVAVIGLIGTLGTAVIANWDTLTGDDNQPSSEANSDSQDSNESGANDSSSTPINGDESGSTSNDSGDSEAEVGGCSIDVNHIGASIQEEPDHSARTISGVPDGTYAALAWEEAEWAGKTELWFKIEANSREGWIVDSPILITSKTADCP